MGLQPMLRSTDKIQGGREIEGDTSHEPVHHLPTLLNPYRRLLPSPALVIPFNDWTAAGDLTILLISVSNQIR